MIHEEYIEEKQKYDYFLNDRGFIEFVSQAAPGWKVAETKLSQSLLP